MPARRLLRAAPANLRLDQLTAREREVLEVVAQGLDNNAIAKRFGVSEKTVRNQVSAILGKLEVESRSKRWYARAKRASVTRDANEHDAAIKQDPIRHSYRTELENRFR